MHDYHLEVCRGKECTVVSAAKTVEVLRTKTPAPQPPVAPERSTSVRYKVTFTSASAKFNVVSLLENGREVDSHTISGSGDSQEWSRTFVADRRDAPGTYHYEVQSCNGSGCAVSKAITVVVTGGGTTTIVVCRAILQGLRLHQSKGRLLRMSWRSLSTPLARCHWSGNH